MAVFDGPDSTTCTRSSSESELALYNMQPGLEAYHGEQDMLILHILPAEQDFTWLGLKSDQSALEDGHIIHQQNYTKIIPFMQRYIGKTAQWT